MLSLDDMLYHQDSCPAHYNITKRVDRLRIGVKVTYTTSLLFKISNRKCDRAKRNTLRRIVVNSELRLENESYLQKSKSSFEFFFCGIFLSSLQTLFSVRYFCRNHYYFSTSTNPSNIAPVC